MSSSYLENILITEDSAGFSLKHLLEPRLQNFFIPIGLVGNATKQVIQGGGKKNLSKKWPIGRGPRAETATYFSKHM